MNGLTRRSALGVLAAAGLSVKARAQAPVTLKIAYPAWDTTEQQKAVTGIFADYERLNPNVKIELISRCRSRCCASASSSRRAPAIRPTSPIWTAAGCPKWPSAGLLADITDSVAKLDRARLVRGAVERRDRGWSPVRHPGPHRSVAQSITIPNCSRRPASRPSRRPRKSSPTPPRRSPPAMSTAGVSSGPRIRA